MPFRPILISVVAALGLGVTFVACGGDDSASTSVSASASSGAAASETRTGSATPKKSATPKATTTPRDASRTPEGTSTVNDATPEINECGLVSLSNLNDAIAGDNFTAAGKAGSGRVDTCTFNGARGTSVELTTFNLTAYGPGNEKEFFETFASIFGDDIVNDPGDEAYYDNTVGLSVLKSPYELDIAVTKPDATLDKEASFALAVRALSNMP